MRSVAIVLLLACTAHAARRTVVSPLQTADAKLASTIEASLVDAARTLTMIEIVNLDGGKPKGPSRVDARAEQRPIARAQSLARERNAELAIVCDPQALGDGAIAYLEVVDANGKVVGSTTVALSGEALKSAVDRERALRGGLTQILDPTHFTGRLALRVDVQGARIEIDGKVVADQVDLPVGPHAVRVTQPAYRDYLRFVDVAFDRTIIESVALAAFPLTEGEMAQKRGRPIVTPKVPWYRSWWALGITGVVLVGATTGIVFAARPGISADHDVHYTWRPAP